MTRLLNYFFRGLIVLVPIVLTTYVCWKAFEWVDRLLGLSIPGAGFVITVVAITFVGFLASSLLTRSVVTLLEGLLARLPFVRLLYASTKDLLNAFVGEHRRFDKPVLVSLDEDGIARAFGFVTQDSLHALGLSGDDVAVYFPWSYSFAGRLMIYPSSRVTPVTADSAAMMAFIVSGGVTTPPPSPTTDTPRLPSHP